MNRISPRSPGLPSAVQSQATAVKAVERETSLLDLPHEVRSKVHGLLGSRDRANWRLVHSAFRTDVSQSMPKEIKLRCTDDLAKLRSWPALFPKNMTLNVKIWADQYLNPAAYEQLNKELAEALHQLPDKAREKISSIDFSACKWLNNTGFEAVIQVFGHRLQRPHFRQALRLLFNGWT